MRPQIALLVAPDHTLQGESALLGCACNALPAQQTRTTRARRPVSVATRGSSWGCRRKLAIARPAQVEHLTLCGLVIAAAHVSIALSERIQPRGPPNVTRVWVAGQTQTEIPQHHAWIAVLARLLAVARLRVHSVSPVR